MGSVIRSQVRQHSRVARRALFLEALEARNLLASYTTPEDTSLVVTEIAPAIGEVAAEPLHGKLTVFATGGFSYAPAENYFGADRFTYRPINPTTASGLVEVELAVTPVNDAPVANDDSFATRGDAGLTIGSRGLLENDRDVDSNALSVLLAVGSGPSHGTLTTSATGQLVYRASPNFVGRDSFLYFASDGQAASAKPATVTISVEAITHLPEARNDSYEVKQGGTLNVPAPGVLFNDSGTPGTQLLASLVTGVGEGNGALTLNGDGSVRYVPPPQFSGKVSFTYRAVSPATSTPPVNTNPAAVSNIATVTITVVPTPPLEARPDQYGMEQGGTLNVAAPGVLFNDGGSATRPLFASVVTAPTNGELRFNADGSFVYVPKASFYGIETFSYRASDQSPTIADSNLLPGNTSIAKVYISVRATAPEARADKYEIDFGQTLAVAAPGVLGNDSSVNGSVLVASLVEKPARGEVKLNGDGSFTYIPAAGFSGTETFKYRASVGLTNTDPAGIVPPTSNTATVTIFVRPRIVLPEARNDEFAVQQGATLTVEKPGVLKNDGVSGQVLFGTQVEGPSHGKLTFNTDGSFVYVPSAEFFGVDKFTYRASAATTNSDPTTGPIASNVATVFIKVGPIVSPPIAQNDRYEMKQGAELTVASPGVLANDGLTLALRLMATLEAGPANGTLALKPDGSFHYVPKPGFHGVDTFKYRASPFSPPPDTDASTPNAAATLTTDPATGSIATVTIVVAPVPVTARAQDDKYTASAGHELVVQRPGVLANDGVTSVNALIVAKLASEPANGRVNLNSDGSFTYVPATGFSGIDSFTYRASLATTASGTILPEEGSLATVYINVVKPNPFHNAARPKDVNGDRRVSTVDAVLVINRMSNPTPFSMGEGEASSLPFYDVNGDGLLTTIDALLVINELMSPQAAAEADDAEGESSAAVAADESLEATLSALACDAEELAARKRARLEWHQNSRSLMAGNA